MKDNEIINKFKENPGRFTSLVLGIYWEMKDKNDIYKSELDTLNLDNHRLQRKIDELERKAEAYELLKEDLEINEKVFKQQAENDEVSAIIHGHYIALLEQSKLESDDEMKDKQYKDTWQEVKAEMMKSYANYEEQKRINKNMGIHKILEGAQISLAPVLEKMDELDESNEFNNLLVDIESK